MGAGQHLDRLGIGGVPGDEPVIVPIGTNQIGQHLGIPGIRFGSRDVVTIAVAGCGYRIDRPHLKTSPTQC
ncbi:hypothetical protein Y900_028050 [Mycolicibacterium aromaticivorans JS19b1 = JCM 16368]|uniref:Uncharacterized protein n=1 Tax=Mycolicibacterium aromaticivorans JS19b1 = JCM 16368 TaxID=1440774 RepID=A0A064CBT4_9MYCO|nr:hypothetical protein Y900_028050 [Mycolicibacterium aromaticivorans JS19b1 = JCM 16368]